MLDRSVVDWLVDWLIDWLTVDRLFGWLVDGLIDRLIYWFIGWSMDWLVHRLIDWLICDSSISCLSLNLWLLNQFFSLLSGMALSPNSTLIVTNWRTKEIIEIDFDGKVIRRFTCEDFQCPCLIAVNSKGEIFVADSGTGVILAFTSTGKMLRKITGLAGNRLNALQAISCFESGDSRDIVLADDMIKIYDEGGRLRSQMGTKGKDDIYQSVVLDAANDLLLASKTEKRRNVIEVWKYSTSSLQFVIDSFECKLRRPAGLVLDGNMHLLVRVKWSIWIFMAKNNSRCSIDLLVGWLINLLIVDWLIDCLSIDWLIGQNVMSFWGCIGFFSYFESFYFPLIESVLVFIYLPWILLFFFE